MQSDFPALPIEVISDRPSLNEEKAEIASVVEVKKPSILLLVIDGVQVEAGIYRVRSVREQRVITGTKVTVME